MVAMNVWPTDGADGSVATEARWRKMGRHWAPTGVLPGVGGMMKPSLAGTALTVLDGAAWVDGHFAELLGTQVLTVTANGIAVVRFDPAANTAELVWRDGVTVPAQSPTGVYEMLIASVTGSVGTDRRTIARLGSAIPTGVDVFRNSVPLNAQWSTFAWAPSDVIRNAGWWNSAAPTKFTVPATQPAATWYEWYCGYEFAIAGPEGDVRNALPWKNGGGSGGYGHAQANRSGYGLMGNYSIPMRLDPGDYIELYIFLATWPITINNLRCGLREIYTQPLGTTALAETREPVDSSWQPASPDDVVIIHLEDQE